MEKTVIKKYLSFLTLIVLWSINSYAQGGECQIAQDQEKLFEAYQKLFKNSEEFSSAADDISKNLNKLTEEDGLLESFYNAFGYDRASGFAEDGEAFFTALKDQNVAQNYKLLVEHGFEPKKWLHLIGEVKGATLELEANKLVFSYNEFPFLEINVDSKSIIIGYTETAEEGEILHTINNADYKICTDCSSTKGDIEIRKVGEDLFIKRRAQAGTGFISNISPPPAGTLALSDFYLDKPVSFVGIYDTESKTFLLAPSSEKEEIFYTGDIDVPKDFTVSSNQAHNQVNSNLSTLLNTNNERVGFTLEVNKKAVKVDFYAELNESLEGERAVTDQKLAPSNYHDQIFNRLEEHLNGFNLQISSESKGINNAVFFDHPLVKEIKEEVFHIINNPVTPDHREFISLKNSKGLTDDELIAIVTYTSNKYFEETALHPYQILNTQLRDGELDDFNKAFKAVLDAGLNKLESNNVFPLWRGTSQIESDIASTWEVGDLIRFEDYKSTTKVQAQTLGFFNGDGYVLYKINGEVGGFDISSFSDAPEEAEVLFKPREEFRVKKIETNETLIPGKKLTVITLRHK